MLANFVFYGAIFFDRLAPLYLIGFVTDDLPVRAAGVGGLALAIGLGWAVSMLPARWASGRWDDRRRVLVAAAGVTVCGAASLLAPSWWLFCLLRGLGGIAAGTSAPAVTALTFAASPVRRRGLDLGIVQASTRVLGSLAAPVVATAVAVRAGWIPALATASAFVSVGAVVVGVLVPRPGGPARLTPAKDAELTWRPHGRRNMVLSAAVATALVAWLITTSQSAVPLVEQWLDVGPGAAGRVVGWFGVGAAIAALAVPIGSDWIGRRWSLAVAAAVGAAGGFAALYGAATGLWASTVAASALLAVAGVAMGGLPLAISIIPAEAVATGDVGRALAVPIVTAELLGGAALPAVAAAIAPTVGLPVAVGVIGSGLVASVVLGLAIQPASAHESS